MAIPEDSVPGACMRPRQGVRGVAAAWAPPAPVLGVVPVGTSRGAGRWRATGRPSGPAQPTVAHPGAAGP